MKIVVIISSYNRYDYLIRLLNQLKGQTYNGDIDIIISDDCSPDNRYLTINDTYPDIKIIRGSVNNGKRGYWKTINGVLNLVKEKDFDYLIQLDDDFVICDNFLNQVTTFFKEQVDNDTSVVSMSLHLNCQNDLNGSRWSLGNNWVDGGTIYTKNGLLALDFKINEVSKNRWTDNPNMSSGVWQQVSIRFNKLKLKCLKVNYSFLSHNDNDNSHMNTNLRVKEPINSYNFIADLKDVDLRIIKQPPNEVKNKKQKVRQALINQRARENYKNLQIAKARKKKRLGANLMGQTRRVR